MPLPASEPILYREELIQAIASLELKAKKRVTSLLVGDYRSAFKGSGMQFKEFRRYEPGDDIRHLSWTVTARTGHPTVKLYEEERELNVLLLIDVSGSSLFAVKDRPRLEMYSELVALIGFAAIRSGDSFGMLLFSDEPHAYLPPSRTRHQVSVAIRKLLGEPFRGKKSDLRPALTHLRRGLRRKTLVMVLSDFLLPSFSSELSPLCGFHDMILLHCYDDAERGQLGPGVLEARDPETGEIFLLDGNSKRVRNHLAQHQLQLSQTLEDSCRELGADYLPLSAEDDYLQRLVHFFRNRGPSHL